MCVGGGGGGDGGSEMSLAEGKKRVCVGGGNTRSPTEMLNSITD